MPEPRESADNTCRFNDSVLEFIGRLVWTRSVYGWGWYEGNGLDRTHQHEDTTKSVAVPVPAPFQFELTEFADWNGERRGGIGLIKEAGHIYDGRWFLFYLRHIGCFDFQQKIGQYNFHIGHQRPSLYAPSHYPEMAKHWPLPRFPDVTTISGNGQVGVSVEAIDESNKKRAAEAGNKTFIKAGSLPNPKSSS